MAWIWNLPKPIKTILLFNTIQVIGLTLFILTSSLYECINITKNVKLFCKVTCLYTIVLHLAKALLVKVDEVVIRSRKVLMWAWLKGFLLLLTSILSIHFIAILYGAAIIEASSETFHFASLLGCLGVFPCICLSVCLSPHHPASYLLTILFGIGTKGHAQRQGAFMVMVATVVGAWMGAFPLPLDWDAPWQIWPVSCVYGCLVGNMVGLLASSTHLTITSPHHKHHKFKKAI